MASLSESLIVNSGPPLMKAVVAYTAFSADREEMASSQLVMTMRPPDEQEETRDPIVN
jgi:hypothetical protein